MRVKLFFSACVERATLLLVFLTILFGQKTRSSYAARQDSPSVYEMSPTEPEQLQTKLKEMSS